MLLPFTLCLYTWPVIITVTLLFKMYALHVPVPLSFRTLFGGPVSRDGFHQGLSAFSALLYHTYCLLCFLHQLDTLLQELHQEGCKHHNHSCCSCCCCCCCHCCYYCPCFHCHCCIILPTALLLLLLCEDCGGVFEWDGVSISFLLLSFCCC